MLGSIDTVLFDLDGTLTLPVIDFKALREKLGLPLGGGSLIAALAQLPAKERAAKEAVILEAEQQAARLARPNHGAHELVAWLRERGFKTAVVTRNHPDAVEITLKTLNLKFEVILHRLSGVPTKPAPDAVLEALRRLGARPQGALMVGDFVDDVVAGRTAGTRTCFITNGERRPPSEADLSVAHPGELLRLFAAA